ncbi:MAG: hypothetical protein AMXMBFR64_37020 [Myxococcales bacterium]
MNPRSWSVRRSLLVTLIWLTFAPTVSCGGQETSRDPRDRVIAEVVVPETLDHDVIVFALPVPLRPGDRIGPYTQPGRSEGVPARTIERETWFYWIDDAPSARFSHPTRYVFVDAETGAIGVESHAWWPVLNGASLWTDDYWDESHWVFSTVGGAVVPRSGDRAPGSAGGGMVQIDPPPLALPAGVRESRLSVAPGDSGMAIVINGWAPGESGQRDFQTDAQNMHDVLEAAGFDTTYLGDAADTATERDGINDAAARAAFFAQAAAKLGCGDTLVVYVSAHGSVIGDGPLSGLAHSDGVWEDDLASWLRGVKDCVKVIVVIDSCHSGGFVDGLAAVADLVITSTDQGGSAYGDLDGPGDPNPHDQGGEFTGGLVAGLFETLTAPESLDAAQQHADESGTSLWEEVFGQAFDTALALDEAHRRGLTVPQRVRGTRGEAGTCEECEPAPSDCGESCPPLALGCGYMEPLGAGTCGAPEGSGEAELGKALAILLGQDPASQAVCQDLCEAGGVAEAGNDTVHSLGSLTAPAEGEVDILQFGSLKLTLSEELAAGVTVLFPCGSSSVGATLCGGPDALAPGDWQIFYQRLAGPIPTASPTAHYQYGFAIDADGVETNNYKASAQYPKDFFDGTDLWYQVTGSPGAGLSLQVTDARSGGFRDVASRARVFVMGDALVLLAPATEIAVGSPGYRVTAFRHAGDYGIAPPHEWSGDVVPPVGAPLAH